MGCIYNWFSPKFPPHTQKPDGNLETKHVYNLLTSKFLLTLRSKALNPPYNQMWNSSL